MTDHAIPTTASPKSLLDLPLDIRLAMYALLPSSGVPNRHIRQHRPGEAKSSPAHRPATLLVGDRLAETFLPERSPLHPLRLTCRAVAEDTKRLLYEHLTLSWGVGYKPNAARLEPSQGAADRFLRRCAAVQRTPLIHNGVRRVYLLVGGERARSDPRPRDLLGTYERVLRALPRLESIAILCAEKKDGHAPVLHHDLVPLVARLHFAGQLPRLAELVFCFGGTDDGGNDQQGQDQGEEADASLSPRLTLHVSGAMFGQVRVFGTSIRSLSITDQDLARFPDGLTRLGLWGLEELWIRRAGIDHDIAEILAETLVAPKLRHLHILVLTTDLNLHPNLLQRLERLTHLSLRIRPEYGEGWMERSRILEKLPCLEYLYLASDPESFDSGMMRNATPEVEASFYLFLSKLPSRITTFRTDIYFLAFHRTERSYTAMNRDAAALIAARAPHLARIELLFSWTCTQEIARHAMEAALVEDGLRRFQVFRVATRAASGVEPVVEQLWTETKGVLVS